MKVTTMALAAVIAVFVISLSLCSAQEDYKYNFEGECFDGKEYYCGCRTTCANYEEYQSYDGCSDCVEGCFCPEGYVEEGGKCIFPEECPLRPQLPYPPPTDRYPTPPSTEYHRPPSTTTTYPAPPRTTTGYPSPPRTTPGYPTPPRTTPAYPTPPHTTPGYPSPPRTTPGYPTPPRITPGYPTPPRTTPGYPTPPRTTPGYPTPPRTTPGYPTPPHTTPGYPSPPVYPYPSPEYPYDPYEPYDPFDPYPFQYCELNEDEYGRPYYGPFDEYFSGDTYRPRLPEGYPTSPPPTRYPPSPPGYPPATPGYPTPPPPPPYRRYPYPVPTTSLPPREIYAADFNGYGRKKRQAGSLSLPTCITSNECYQRPQTCSGSGTQYDSCGRRCTCRNGQLVDCCRVRKEWHSMTQVERCRYADAIYTVSTSAPWKACYDQLIAIHRTQFNAAIHEEDFFLPWHRWFILSLENLLRQIDCTITVPYWDWSAESQTWQNSVVWAPQCGFGGNGNPVTTGDFRSGNWQLTPSAGSGPLRRNFGGDVPDCAAVAMIQRLGVAEFMTWHSLMEQNLHGSVHCIIGGTMCTRDSANAPEFFLHHGFIDQIWAAWQNKGPAFKDLPHFAQNTNAMPGAYGTTPRDVYDLNNQPGCVRVCIQPPSRPCRANTSYTPLCPREMNCYEYSPNKLADLIPRPYPRVPQEAYELFMVPPHRQRISERCTQLFNSRADLDNVLRNNGYYVGSTRYRHDLGEVQLASYIYQPPTPVYTVTSSNGTTYQPPPPPPVCEPYLDPFVYGKKK